MENKHGTFLSFARQASDFLPNGDLRVRTAMREIGNTSLQMNKALFLDIETCGLANCPLFLVGTVRMDDGDLVVEQFFARDYSEEPALLFHISKIISEFRVLVTFNGRTFDVPYIRDRQLLYRMESDITIEHLDLLPKARLKWKGHLPDCRLQTLEKHICGRTRVGDTPGSLIPQVYHDFVKSGNAAPMEGVFYHNALDLITMAELLPSILD